MDIFGLIVGFLVLTAQPVLTDSQRFTLRAVTSYDINSAIQLYPLTVVNGSLVLAKEVDELSYVLDEDGYAEIENSDYKLVVDDDKNGLLTANTTGTPIFYITGDHLHYNSDFVFIACPKGEGNSTFAVYANSNLGICDDSLVFTLRPVLANDTEVISSYVPDVLDGKTSSSAISATAGPLLSRSLKSSFSTVTQNGGIGQTSSKSGATATSSSSNNNIITETISAATVQSTDDNDNVVTETIIVQNEETLESSQASITVSSTDDGDDGVITLTTYVDPSASKNLVSTIEEVTTVTKVSTSSGCADTDCNTVFISLVTVTEITTSSSDLATSVLTSFQTGGVLSNIFGSTITAGFSTSSTLGNSSLSRTTHLGAGSSTTFISSSLILAALISLFA